MTLVSSHVEPHTTVQPIPQHVRFEIVQHWLLCDFVMLNINSQTHHFVLIRLKQLGVS